MADILRRFLTWRRARVWPALPGVCVLCDQATGQSRDLCDDCHTALPWLECACRRCGLPTASGMAPLPGAPPDAACIACRISPPPYERCVAPLRYATPVAEMIRRVKFSNDRAQARVLGTLLGEHVVQAQLLAEVDLIVPVPLGRGRLLRRGYNQAALLARWVGRASGLPVDWGLCRRSRATRAQSGLSRRARRINLRGAFAVNARLDGARIAIVDDVVTTGATVAALTRTLLRAGAAGVQVWAVARTLEREPGSGSPH